MRHKSNAARPIPLLRVIVTKPGPDQLQSPFDKDPGSGLFQASNDSGAKQLIPKTDEELLDRILAIGVSFDKYYCIDCVGGERPRETIRLSVTLCGSATKERLHKFITEFLGSPLFSLGTHGDRIVGALEEAEDHGIVHMRKIMDE